MGKHSIEARVSEGSIPSTPIFYAKVYKIKNAKLDMAKGGHDFSEVAYILGVISIVMAFVSPIGGIIFGILGIVYGNKQKSDLSMKGKTLSTIGLVLAVIMLIISVGLTAYLGLTSPQGLFG